MTQAAFFGDAARIACVYAQGRREAVAALSDLYPHVLSCDNLGEHAPRLANTEALWTTWGMPNLSPEDLDKLPHLRLVLYAAGSVQNFARPLLERGVTVVSAWQANAVPVAEYALAQILLANKGYFHALRRAPADAPRQLRRRRRSLGRGRHRTHPDRPAAPLPPPHPRLRSLPK